jgi:hypothetical protein
MAAMITSRRGCLPWSFWVHQHHADGQVNSGRVRGGSQTSSRRHGRRQQATKVYDMGQLLTARPDVGVSRHHGFQGLCEL